MLFTDLNVWLAINKTMSQLALCNKDLAQAMQQESGGGHALFNDKPGIFENIQGQRWLNVNGKLSIFFQILTTQAKLYSIIKISFYVGFPFKVALQSKSLNRFSSTVLTANHLSPRSDMHFRAFTASKNPSKQINRLGFLFSSVALLKICYCHIKIP